MEFLFSRHRGRDERVRGDVHVPALRVRRDERGEREPGRGRGGRGWGAIVDGDTEGVRTGFRTATSPLRAVPRAVNHRPGRYGLMLMAKLARLRRMS